MSIALRNRREAYDQIEPRRPNRKAMILDVLTSGDPGGMTADEIPSAKFTINKAADGCIYHTDGKTAWVEVSITINDQTETESLAVMDFRNKSIPIDTITSADAEKSIKRCLVKCAALHGLGLSLWTGEELSSAARKKKEDDLDDVKQEILSVVAGKLEAGVSKDTIYKAIESVAGVKNPNAIKDIATAQKVVEQIKKLEVKHNA